VGHLSYFPRRRRESPARFTSTRRFDRGVERQKIRLLGDSADRDDELVDLTCTGIELAHLCGGLLDDRAHVEKNLERAVDLDALRFSLGFDCAGESVHLLGATDEVIAAGANAIE